MICQHVDDGQSLVQYRYTIDKWVSVESSWLWLQANLSLLFLTLARYTTRKLKKKLGGGEVDYEMDILLLSLSLSLSLSLTSYLSNDIPLHPVFFSKSPKKCHTTEQLPFYMSVFWFVLTCKCPILHAYMMSAEQCPSIELITVMLS